MRAYDSTLLRVSQATIDTLELQRTMRLLQQLECFRYKDGEFILNSEFEDLVDKLIRHHSVLTESALWERLERQRLRGMFIEECVVEEERNRLRLLGCMSLADAVIRVSKTDVNLGYDILSFESDGRNRYIEVKSSTGFKLDFRFSKHERDMAEEIGESYWVYFVPLAHLVEKKINFLLRIRDPIQKLKKRRIIASPSEWRIVANETTEKQIEASFKERSIFDW